MAGRRPLNGQRMKPNGLSAELDNWYAETAKISGLTSMALKRRVLQEYHDRMIRLGDIAAETPQTLVSGE